MPAKADDVAQSVSGQGSVWADAPAGTKMASRNSSRCKVTLRGFPSQNSIHRLDNSRSASEKQPVHPPADTDDERMLVGVQLLTALAIEARSRVAIEQIQPGGESVIGV